MVLAAKKKIKVSHFDIYIYICIALEMYNMYTIYLCNDFIIYMNTFFFFIMLCKNHIHIYIYMYYV